MNYPESLLQWIWGSLQFDPRSMYTVEGHKLEIIHPGVLNNSDGPDYKRASCNIDDLEWHGSIEIHWRSNDWYRHGHHRNPDYDNVFLHIVVENNLSGAVETSRGHTPHTLILGSHLNLPLQTLFKRFDNPHILPCAPYLRAHDEEVFLKQLDKANKAYFEKKIESLMAVYPPGLPLSRAWKSMLSIGLFDGLGILHNRAPMRRLARHILYECEAAAYMNEEDKFIQWVYRLAFSKANNWTNEWHTKGCRPPNHPKTRVKQAASFYFQLNNIAFKEWLSQDSNPELLWRNMLNQSMYRPGKQRANVLYTTVFLPAIYILGQLVHSTNKKQWSYDSWRHARLRIPGSIEKVFKESGLLSNSFLYNPGTVYLKKAFCDQRQCNQCEVLKSAVYS